MALRSDRLAETTSEQAVFKRAAFLTGVAITLSAATIFAFDAALSSLDFGAASSSLQLFALTLFPYMLSAVIAAMTAIAVMSMLPSASLAAPTKAIRDRLQAMASGDLAGKVGLKPKSATMQAMISELNLATSTIGHDIATWKLINRQNWELLEAMREITVVGGQAQLVTIIEQMERNWERIAEIEAKIRT